MADQVTIKPETNKVELTDQRRQISVTDNRTGTSINLTQTDPQLIQINTPGPQGASGIATTSGSFSGSFQGDGSLLTGIVASGSIDSASVAISASFAETASYAVSASHEIIKEISSSFADTASIAQNLEGEFTYSGEVFTVQGNVFVQGTLDAATKNFKIDHPTMEGYYLVHSSLEGPERGIYHRGKLKVSNTIHLPDYWKDLPVDDVDITVQLTPIGNACQHFVKSVSKEEIEIGCDCGKPHCFYIVHAQRYDQGKFEVLEPKLKKSL